MVAREVSRMLYSLVVSRETWPEEARCGGRTISDTAREVSRVVLRMSSLRVARVVSRETWPSPGGGEARRCGGRTISETAREVSREACSLVGVEEVL